MIRYLVIIQLLCYIVQVQCCGKYEYQSSNKDGTCEPCRVCPKNVHLGGSGIEQNQECFHKNREPYDFLPPHIGPLRVPWCDGEEYPLPWCKEWTDPNGQVNCDHLNGTINSVCELKCNVGYIANGTVVKSKCDGNLTWSPEQPVCVKLRCKEWTDPNGQVNCDHLNGTINSVCKLKCNVGYRADGLVVKSKCDGNLTWSPEKPVCVLGCKEWTDPNGQVNCDHLNRTINSVCELKCNVGYIADGLVVKSKCDGNLTWSPGQPVCVKPGREMPLTYMWIIVIIPATIALIIIVIAVIFREKIQTFFTRSGYENTASSDSSSEKTDLEMSQISGESGNCVTSESTDQNGSTEENERQMTPSKTDTVVEIGEKPEFDEWTNENAGYDHLRKVIEDPKMMRKLEKYLNREKEANRVTWHLIAEELGYKTTEIHNCEYEHRTGALYQILSRFYQNGDHASLKFLLEFFKRTRSRFEQGSNDYNSHTMLIQEMFKVGNGQDLNSV